MARVQVRSKELRNIAWEFLLEIEWTKLGIIPGGDAEKEEGPSKADGRWPMSDM